MAEFELIADGLRFPEAPVVMDDGSVIVTEIEAGRITRCWTREGLFGRPHRTHRYRNGRGRNPL